MPDTASDLARRLAENAEAVCRHYLSKGRRHGRYWLAGNVRNTPGRSLYVRLRGPGTPGRWTDAATGERGDLLDLIAAATGTGHFGDTLEEARRFLGLTPPSDARPALPGSPDAVRKLFAMGVPIAGTLAETYLRQRGIAVAGAIPALRFHPRCYYRADPDDPDSARDTWPALLAAVTDADGSFTGVQRTYLDPSGRGKAAVATPRRAMGLLLGNAVRFGAVADTMAVGEGIETVLSLHSALPCLPLAAALSAAHLAAFVFPTGLRRLYVTRDRDRAGLWAAGRLVERAEAAGVEAIALVPEASDFNDDLRQRGPDVLAAALRVQLVPEDVIRFWRPSKERDRAS